MLTGILYTFFCKVSKFFAYPFIAFYSILSCKMIVYIENL